MGNSTLHTTHTPLLEWGGVVVCWKNSKVVVWKLIDA